MGTILGFVAKKSFINNADREISELFEISPFALTFSKHRGEYRTSTSQYLDNALHTLLTTDDAGVYRELTDAEVDEVFMITAVAGSYIASHYPPYSTSDLIYTLQAAFIGAPEGFVSDISVGSFYTDAKNNTMPEWISWTSPISGATVKIWYRNEALENQYTNYEIVVVPPVDALDSFFGAYGPIASAVGGKTFPDILSRFQEFKNGDPESYARAFSFEYYNPNNLSEHVSVCWGGLIYGVNGDNIDAIKDAIVNYVLSHSAHTIDEWKVIFPDIFKRTEFLIWPRWDKLAIQNLTTYSSIYSALSDPTETLEFAQTVFPSVNADFLKANLTVIPFDFKAIHAICLNGSSNISAKARIQDVIPDYIPVSTGALDFTRMSTATQQWVFKIIDLLILAEKANEFSSVEYPVRRVFRDEKLYLSLMIDSVNYLVATRSNML